MAQCVPFGLGSSSAMPGQSCLDIFQATVSPADGVYWIDLNGAPTSDAFQVYCDMTCDGGGWTLLRMSDGTPTLAYDASLWTDTNLLDATDLTLTTGNAKYQSFVVLPVTTLRGELDGVRYTKAFSGTPTAPQIFLGGSSLVAGGARAPVGALSTVVGFAAWPRFGRGGRQATGRHRTGFALHL